MRKRKQKRCNKEAHISQKRAKRGQTVQKVQEEVERTTGQKEPKRDNQGHKETKHKYKHEKNAKKRNIVNKGGKQREANNGGKKRRSVGQKRRHKGEDGEGLKREDR